MYRGIKQSIGYNLQLLAHFTHQILSAAYAATWLGFVNECFLLFMKRAQIAYGFSALVNLMSLYGIYQYGNLKETLYSNSELFGFLMTQAFFMQNFIKNLYHKKPVENNPWGITLLMMAATYFYQYENFYLLLFLMCINKITYTLANPYLKYFLPLSHEEENHMHVNSVIILQMTKGLQWIGKSSGFFLNLLKTQFSFFSLFMWLGTAFAEYQGEHKNIFFTPAALITNALGIFTVKKLFSDMNKSPETLNDKQLRIFYLLSFLINSATFFVCDYYLNRFMSAAYQCLPQMILEQSIFNLRTATFDGSGISYNATVSWIQPSDGNTTAFSTITHPNWYSRNVSTLFNPWTGNHNEVECSDLFFPEQAP